MRRWIGGAGFVVVSLMAGWLLFTGRAAAQTPTLPFSVNPGSGVFPATQIGGTTLKTFTFTWTSSLAGGLGQFGVPAPFVIQANDCGTMKYQETCTVTAGFAPTQAGSAAQSLTFDYTVGADTGTDSISLSGTGVTTPTPPFGFSPGSGEFPDTRVGDTSSITFTFRWISLPGGLSDFDVSAPFAIESDTCAKINFPNSCSVRVGFRPTEFGRAAGRLAFTYTAGSQQGTEKIRLSGTSKRCECTRLKARMIGWSQNHGTRFILALRWKLSCALGHAQSCTGRLQWQGEVKKKLAARGLRLVYPRRSEGFGRLRGSPGLGITCGATRKRGCSEYVLSGVARFKLLGPARLRRGLAIRWRFGVVCFSHPKRKRTRSLTIRFDRHGRLDRRASHLGPITS